MHVARGLEGKHLIRARRCSAAYPRLDRKVSLTQIDGSELRSQVNAEVHASTVKVDGRVTKLGLCVVPLRCGPRASLARDRQA